MNDEIRRGMYLLADGVTMVLVKGFSRDRVWYMDEENYMDRSNFDIEISTEGFFTTIREPDYYREGFLIEFDEFWDKYPGAKYLFRL